MDAVGNVLGSFTDSVKKQTSGSGAGTDGEYAKHYT